MLKAILLLCVFQCLWLSGNAQIEHNFKRDPEKTDCHELESRLENRSEDKVTGEGDLYTLITSSSYRVTESMKVSRYKVPNKLMYFSCDGKLGYLVADENDSTRAIYTKIPRNSWVLLTKSNDPIENYRLFKEEFESNRLK